MSETHCEVNFDGASDDCEPVANLRTNHPIARSAHKCLECGDLIALGERYRRDSYVFEEKQRVDRTCSACNEIREEFDFHMLGGFLWEYFDMEWDNGANVQGCMNRLATVRAKATMHERWLDWKGLR